ncbi:MAG: OprO/OprP family phosphate-selective porin [Gemmataceae bacterium]
MRLTTASTRLTAGRVGLVLACLACPAAVRAQERFGGKSESPYGVQPAIPVAAPVSPATVVPAAAPVAPTAPLMLPAEQQAPVLPAAPPASMTGDPVLDAKILAVIKQHEAEKKAQEDAAKAAAAEKLKVEGYVVGSDTGASAKFENGWLWIRTPNNDFTMHIGYWLQMDAVFWKQAPALKAPQGGRAGPPAQVSGANLGGIGPLSDGFFFRRVRPFIEGTFYETFEYRFNLALENDQFQTTGLDEFWVGMNKIPLIGTVRIGHFKNAMGLEGDMSSSSRTMTFMERSSYSEAIELNQNFGTGLWFGNSFLDDRVTYQATIVRPDNGFSSGAFFGSGQWGWNIRTTALPLYEDEGRQLLHVGASIGYRNGTNNIDSLTTPTSDRTITLAARPEMRDDVPEGNANNAGAQAAGLSIPNGNSNRMISTGPLAIADDWILGLEMLYIRGPFSIQGEYGWNFVVNAYGVSPGNPAVPGGPFGLHPAIVPAQNYTFQGGYVQLAYTLTGENRAYDRKTGTLARDYFKNGPFTNAWFTRDCDGGLNWGWGAWEIAGRYSYVNLNDGVFPTRIQGGDMQGVGVGLNWYLNRDLKIQFDWNYDYRYNLPAGVPSGWTCGFGIETQLSF